MFLNRFLDSIVAFGLQMVLAYKSLLILPRESFDSKPVLLAAMPDA